MSREKKSKFEGLPGQTRDPPPPMDSCRLFYSSMYKQKGIKSLMATKWMLQNGLLPIQLARKLDDGIWDPRQLVDVRPKFNFRPAKVVSKEQTVVVKTVRFNLKPAKKSTVKNQTVCQKIIK